MSDLTLILLCAGDSTRFNLPLKKQWLRIGHEPLWQFVTNRLKQSGLFSNVILTAHPDEVPFMQMLCDETIISGGKSRQESLFNALQSVQSEYVMVTDVARACVDIELIKRLITHKNEADVIVPALSVTDTTVYKGNTIAREEVYRIQTPQLSRTQVLRSALHDALNRNIEYTDESSAIVAFGKTRYIIEGDTDAHKITFASDVKTLPCLLAPSSATLVGNGFDVHAFETGKPMVLGGVSIESDFGFKAHSDGDVAIHALIDALLGAAGLGDIGMLFPDTDAAYKNADSKALLATTCLRLEQFGYGIHNVDITIMAETPRLSAYKHAMRQTLGAILKLPLGRVNIKATTTEKLGFIGRKEGVGVMASASLYYFDWTLL